MVNASSQIKQAPAWNETLPCSGLQHMGSTQSICTCRHSSAARTSKSSFRKGVEDLLAVTSIWLEREKPFFKWTWNQECHMSSAACALFDAGLSSQSQPRQEHCGSKTCTARGQFRHWTHLDIKTRLKSFFDADMKLWLAHSLGLLQQRLELAVAWPRAKETPKHAPKCLEYRKKQLLTGSNRHKSAFNHDFSVKVTAERLLL